jgi:hypothetical protein
MNLAVLQDFFMWCSILNCGLLLLSVLVCTLASDWAYRMHSRWFHISREAFNVSIYAFVGVYKLIIIGFCLIPYFAILIIK